MKEVVQKLVDEKIASLGLFVNDAFIKKEDGITSLNIILDSKKVIDLDLITEASNIINPIMDDADLVDGEYVLDISSLEKGGEENE